MKKSAIILVGLVSLSILSLSACGANNANTNSEESAAKTTVATADNGTVGSAGSAGSDTSANKEQSKKEVAEDRKLTESKEETNAGTDMESSTDNADSNEAAPNLYGYYEEKNPPQSGLSVAALSGIWRDTGIGTETLTITSGSDIYSGDFSFKGDYYGSSTTGYVKLEYLLTQDGTKDYRYTFYEEDGTLWNAFVADGTIPLEDLYGGPTGGTHFHRETTAQTEVTGEEQNVMSIEAYAGTYVEEIAGRGVITFTVDAAKNCYFHVTWPSSASETAEWDFTATYNDIDTFSYSDCVKKVIKYDEDGSQITEDEYANGTGYMKISKRSDGTYVFTWNDDMENVANGNSFLKQ